MTNLNDFESRGDDSNFTYFLEVDTEDIHRQSNDEFLTELNASQDYQEVAEQRKGFISQRQVCTN